MHSSHGTRIAFASLGVGGLGGVAGAQVLLQDDFGTFSPSRWVTQTSFSAIGQPQTRAPTIADNRSALRLKSDWTTNAFAYRGFKSSQVFTVPALEVSMTFKPIAGEGIADLVLQGNTTGRIVSIHFVDIPSLGVNRVVGLNTDVPGFSGFSSPSLLWDYNAWYTTKIAADANVIRLSLLDANGAMIWNTTYGFGLAALGSSVRVGFGQFSFAASPPSSAEALIDRITVMPSPAGFSCIVCGLLGAGRRRRSATGGWGAARSYD